LYFALGLGFFLGLKHATEADHLVAVTTIVSEQRSIWRSSMVGVLWGLGHTLSLLLAGIAIILLNVTIPERLAMLLEFTVAVMIVSLGTRVLYLLLCKQRRMHVHRHTHGSYTHSHFHFHDTETAHDLLRPAPAAHRTHESKRIGWKPFVVGILHGMAGSAALTLLVLTEVVQGGSGFLGIAYLCVFGLGSVGGMFLMSALISLPFVFTANTLKPANNGVCLLAGFCSVAFGLYYGWETLGQYFSLP
jgi:sulfite exporter TauE/SafE